MSRRLLLRLWCALRDARHAAGVDALVFRAGIYLDLHVYNYICITICMSIYR